jgi:hypothetical protein
MNLFSIAVRILISTPIHLQLVFVREQNRHIKELWVIKEKQGTNINRRNL